MNVVSRPVATKSATSAPSVNRASEAAKVPSDSKAADTFSGSDSSKPKTYRPATASSASVQAQMKKLDFLARTSGGKTGDYYASLFEQRGKLDEAQQQQWDQKFSQGVLHRTNERGIVTSNSLSHRQAMRDMASDRAQSPEDRKMARRLLALSPEVSEGQVYKWQADVLDQERSFAKETAENPYSLTKEDHQKLAQDLKAGKRPALKGALSQTLLEEAKNKDGDFQSFSRIKNSLRLLKEVPGYQAPAEVTDTLAQRAVEQNKSIKPDKRAAWFLAEAIASSTRPEAFSKHAHLVFHDNRQLDQAPILAAANQQIADGDTRTLDMARQSIMDKARKKEHDYEKNRNYGRSLALVEANGNSLRPKDWNALETLLHSEHPDGGKMLGKLGKTTQGKAHESVQQILHEALQDGEDSVPYSSAQALSKFPDRLNAKNLSRLISGGYIRPNEEDPLSIQSVGQSADKLSDKDFRAVTDTALRSLSYKNGGSRLSGQYFLKEFAGELNDAELKKLSQSEANTRLSKSIAFQRLDGLEGQDRDRELLRVMKEHPIGQTDRKTQQILIGMAQDPAVSESKSADAAKIKGLLDKHVREVATTEYIHARPDYDGSDVIVIALEGTGSHQPGRTRQMMRAAKELRDDGFDTSTLDGSLLDIVDGASGIEKPRWSGLTRGPQRKIMENPEYLDRTQYFSYGSEEFNVIHSRNPLDIIAMPIELLQQEGTSRGVIQATKDVERLMAQAKEQGKNPKLMVLGHSSGGKGALELLERLNEKGIRSPQGELLGNTADVFLIDPVTEAHTAVISSIDSGDVLNGRIRSAWGGLHLPSGYKGQAKVYYQEQDQHGVGFGGGIHGSKVGGCTDCTRIDEALPVYDGKVHGHGELNLHSQVLGTFEDTMDRLLGL